jgi:hypothetical protein
MNTTKPPKNSNYRGVFTAGKKWKAQIQVNGRQIYLGSYASQEEAKLTYEQYRSQSIDPYEAGDASQHPHCSIRLTTMQERIMLDKLVNLGKSLALICRDM